MQTDRTHQPLRPRPHHGFTLVELLVVIGIIALLIAILMPSLAKARKQSLQLACQSNLRQMGQAMVMYTNEYKAFPGCQAFHGGDPFAIWPTRLRKMLGGSARSTGNNVFWCPAQDPGFQWQAKFGTGGPYATVTDMGYGYEEGELLLNVFNVPFSYGYNDWGSEQDGPQGNVSAEIQVGLGGDIVPNDPRGLREVRAGRVRKSAEMISIADNTADSVWDYNIDPYDSHEFPGKIHGGGANFLFVDGHVEWHLQKEMVVGNIDQPNGYAVNRLYNSDNAVHLRDGKTGPAL